VQVEPIKSKLTAPRTKRLKLTDDNLVSGFAFKFNLRRYTEALKENKPLRTLELGRG
jgi:hypothetical protein